MKAAKEQIPATSPSGPAGPASPAGGQSNGGRPAMDAFGGSNEYASGPNLPGAEVVVMGRPAKTFAEAKAAAITEAKDGDDLYVWLHSAEPLSTYGEPYRHAGQAAWYEIVVDITPKGDRRHNDRCIWYLTPEEAAKTDVMLGLSPVYARMMKEPGSGMLTGTKTRCWLYTVAEDSREAGRWENQVHWVNGRQGKIGHTIASAPIVANVPNGFPKWNRSFKKHYDCDARDTPGKVVTCPK
jgi:hypothetical protein